MSTIIRPTVEYLRLSMTGMHEISTSKKLAGYLAKPVPVDSVYMIKGDTRIVDIDGDENLQREFQQWVFVITAKHLDDPDTDEFDCAEEIADAHLDQLQRLLVGWRPAKGFDGFLYRGMREPYYESGYAEFPALFETGRLITGDN